jgi:hypothetical protein
MAPSGRRLDGSTALLSDLSRSLLKEDKESALGYAHEYCTNGLMVEAIDPKRRIGSTN